ncbi:MAG: immunoglobulin-like domain-containing protein, partial [Bacteroidia bacterium]
KGSDSICKKDYIEIREFNTMCSDYTSSSSMGRLFDNGGEDLPYQPAKACYFLIENCDGPLKLNFDQLDIAHGDYIKIWDGNTQEIPLWDINKYPNGITGSLSDASIPKNIIAKSGAASIYFYADSNPKTIGNGFVLDWEVIDSAITLPQIGLYIADTVCTGSLTQAFATVNNYTKLSWDFNNDGIEDYSESASPSFYADTSAQFEVNLTAESFCGAKSSVTKIVNTIINDSSLKRPSYSIENCFVEVNQPTQLIKNSQKCNVQSDLFFENKNHKKQTTTFNKYIIKGKYSKPGFYYTGITYRDSVDSSAITDTILKANSIYVGKYCPIIPTGLNTYGISKIQFANSTINTNNKNYTSARNYTLIEPGKSYNLSAHFNSNNNINFSVYIDLNGDFDFDDLGEHIFAQSHLKDSFINTKITIPNYSIRAKTLMRIIASTSTFKINPCGNQTNFESNATTVIDYYINIENTGASNFEFRLLGNPVDTVNLGSNNYIDSGFICLHKQEGNISHRVQTTGVVNTKVNGTYLLTYTVNDRFNNTYMATRQVTVTDFKSPELSLLGNNPDFVNLNYPYTDPGYLVSDVLDANPTVIVQGKVDTSTFGTYTLKYIATDNKGNKTAKTRKILVGDSLPPVINLIGADSVFVEIYDSTYVDSGYVYYDNDSDFVSVSQTGTWGGVAKKMQTYFIEYIAIDRKRNLASATRKISVGDTTAPSVSLIDSSYIQIDRWTNYTDPGVAYFDNYFDSTQLKVDVLGTFKGTQSAGTFDLIYKVTDPFGNVSAQVKRTIEVLQPSSTNFKADLGISVYPNPATNVLNINCPKKYTFKIIDAFGKTITKGVLNPTNQISIAHFASGIYFIEINGYRHKFIKAE